MQTMQNSWAPSDLDGSGEIFETLHSGLKVKLIATPRDALRTCRPDEHLLLMISSRLLVTAQVATNI
jgi:hypothetical protein